jgi:hypothetical protein
MEVYCVIYTVVCSESTTPLTSSESRGHEGIMSHKKGLVFVYIKLKIEPLLRVGLI